MLSAILAAAVIGAVPGEFADAGELLTALEDVRIGRLSAVVNYVRVQSLAGDTQKRTGRMAFEDDGDGKRFAIEFEKLIVGQRIEDETKRYVFDGEWLVEELPSEKLYQKRQVAPPGSDFDPLAIGEGPMPIPIGQKKDDILERFGAELVAPGDGLESASLIEFVGDAWQLRLVPKDAEDAGLEEVRVWYERSDLRPVMARTIDLDGDEAVVQLLDVRVGEAAEIEAGVFDVTPPPVGSGWDVRIEPWRGHDGASAEETDAGNDD